MISLKAGVSLKDLQPQIVLAMLIVKDLLNDKGLRSFTVTSCNDSTHMKGSLHYKGLAFDTRTHDITLSNRGIWLEQLKSDIKNALGDEFDVILEDLNGPNEHIHTEYDPKPVAEKLPS
jgi:hypothetical protein